GHGLEGLALVPHVALDGLDEVRDQVGAPRELHVDAGHGLVDRDALAAQPVEADDHEPADGDDEHHDDDEDDDQCSHGRDLPVLAPLSSYTTGPRRCGTALTRTLR